MRSWASIPHKRKLRMMIFIIPRDMTEKEILACIMKQNQDKLKEEDSAEMKFCFRTWRKHNEETNWVIEIHPQGYKHIAKYCRVNYEICAHCAESGHIPKKRMAQ
ncbi:uncharacterized protein isoform X3 [Bombus fervidus]|uniref:uncharacterized protein isoform X3 n=1 Tax=Bombus fervidus TaxID=203811 RepID=UPI003D18CB39